MCGGLGWVFHTPLGPSTSTLGPAPGPTLLDPAPLAPPSSAPPLGPALPGPALLSPATGPLVARSLCPVSGQIPAWRKGLVVE